MITDPISDMLIRLKNAALARKPVVVMPFSQLKLSIAELLKEAGYLKTALPKGKKVKKYLEVELTYQGDRPKLQDVERVSKPSRRVYLGAKQIKSVLRGHGLGLYSTSQGLMTDKSAKAAKVGGEYLFKIW